MNGKVIGTYTSTFKDGTVSGRICLEVKSGDNLFGVRVDTVNVSLDNLPVKNLSELVGKNVFISTNGYPKYTWVNDMIIV